MVNSPIRVITVEREFGLGGGSLLMSSPAAWAGAC